MTEIPQPYGLTERQCVLRAAQELDAAATLLRCLINEMPEGFPRETLTFLLSRLSACSDALRAARVEG